MICQFPCTTGRPICAIGVSAALSDSWGTLIPLALFEPRVHTVPPPWTGFGSAVSSLRRPLSMSVLCYPKRGECVTVSVPGLAGPVSLWMLVSSCSGPISGLFSESPLGGGPPIVQMGTVLRRLPIWLPGFDIGLRCPLSPTPLRRPFVSPLLG